jgi:NTE family protein
VGLVLSGGGVRGFAHIGVLKALEENEIPIDYITGTSAGALVGCSYVIGRSPQEIERIFTHPEFIQYGKGIISEEHIFYYLTRRSDPTWFTLKFGIDSMLRTKLPRSVVHSAPADFTLLESTAQASARARYHFDNLMIPFRCVASDIKSKKQVIFREGDLGLAVRASIAFPLYFSPLTMDDRILFDGGLYNNFPIDVMLSEFNPDIVIAVNAAGEPEIPSDDNLLSQVKNILVASQDIRHLRPEDILIEPNINQISVFQFEQTQMAIDSGYAAAMRLMPLIKARIQRRVSHEERQQLRKNFLKDQPAVSIDRIYVKGVRPSQQKYIINTLNPTNACISMAELKRKFYRLAQDEHFLYVFPRLQYNAETEYYDLYLYTRQEKDLLLNVGGNFSSKPISMAFISLQYNVLGSQSLKVIANNYLGKFYNSSSLKLTLDNPGRLRFYLEPAFSISKFDYFKSNSTFFEDVKPSYLIITETQHALDAGMPVRSHGRLIFSSSYFINEYAYYQTKEFSKTDTADESVLTAFSPSLEYERSTLDRKQYATAGNFFRISSRWVAGRIRFTPGSRSLLADTSVSHTRWLQVRLNYENYFSLGSRWKAGLYGDMSLSGQPFFDTYQSTILSTPQFEPTPETSTLFLPQFRSHSFVGGGLKLVWILFNNLQLRTEGYLYQPVQEILENENGHARYGTALEKRYMIGTAGLVFQSPLGPMSLHLSYFQGREKPLSMTFNFGYILFNRRTLR